nr:hypothetical protein [Tanacetum cinerariifolium]
MMKGSDIEEQEKKAKLFNEWEKFTSTDGESIESYYHRFMQPMNDLKRNKHFPENIASNLKFLNNLQPEWKRHVTIVRQTKNLHEADFTQIYDFLKMNQDEVNALRAERLAKSHDPLALMAHSQNSFNFPTTHKDQSSSNINDPTKAMNAVLILFAKAFQLSAPTNNNQRTSFNPRNCQIAQSVMNMGRDRQIQNVGGNGGNQFGHYAGQVAQNQQGYNAWQNGIANQNGTGNVVAARAEGDLDEIEEVNANCILMANLQQASTSGTQHDKAPVYDTNGSTKEDKFLDKEVELEAKIKDLENILLKRDQTVQTMHMLNPKPDSFYHPNQKMALGYPNPSYLKKAQLKQQSLYNGNLLLEEHDAPAVYDSKETLELAQESREKIRSIKKEIKPANYAKINHLSRVQNFEIQFLHKAAKFVRDIKSLAKEADESLDKQKSLALKIERLLKASVSHDILSIVQNGFVNVPSDLQTKLDPYNDMQQKVERLQDQLRDLKGKSSDTSSASNTLDPLNQKLESKIVELEFQVVNYEREISHLKTTYKNMFDSIASNRALAKLHNLVYENAKLRAWLFENTFIPMNNTSGMSVTPHVDKPKLSAATPLSKKLHALMPSHSVPHPKEFNVMKHKNVISPGMFKIINLKCHGQQPKGNTRNARYPSASKSSEVKKNVTIEDHRMTLLLFKNQIIMSSECNNIKLAIRNDKSEIVCDTCKQCLATANHDACLPSFVNALNSRANKLYDNVPPSANQKRHRTHVWKPKQVGSKERLATKHRLPRFSLKWSPSGRSFDLKGKLVAIKETNYPNDDKACTSNPQEPMRKWFPNSTVLLNRLSKFVCGGTLASLEIWMVLTCSKAIVLQISTPLISMTWPQLLPYVCVGITHETSAAKTPQQNGVIERKNRTLVKAARTLLIFSHAPLFLWAEAIATACILKTVPLFTDNYREDIGKLGAKGDIGFFMGYSANSVAYIVYNRRTTKIIETMNVTFDEL